MDSGELTAEMWEGMLPTGGATGQGKVLPDMKRERIHGFGRELINTVINESSPHMTAEAKKTLMGSA